VFRKIGVDGESALSSGDADLEQRPEGKEIWPRVWAPLARSVDLDLGSEGRVPMQADGAWWTAPQPVRIGEDYGFVIDGDGPFPDPRSAFQPHGVHGLSRAVDHSAFAWSDAGWRPTPLASAVIYELHVGTFSEGGTFESAIEHLPHLVQLGVTHVELMPVCEFPGARGWGYDGVDLFAPHHAYGGPEGLKRLVDACHANGLAVVLDVVYNHFGPDGNYLARFGPYFTDRYKTPWGDAVNLDGQGSDEVRRFFCDNALLWLRDYHVDALRLDAVHAFIDTSAVHFLEQLGAEVETLAAASGRQLALIAESDLNDPRLVRSRESGGYGLDAQWSDDFHHALHSVLTGERSGYYEDFGSVADLATALRDVFVYAGRLSAHRGRTHGRSPGALPGPRFVVSVQNHDQVGNRAVGDRLSQTLSTGQLQVAAALLLTSPFVPMLFQGEEWGAATPFQYFTSHEDETLGRLVSEGRCREFVAFGWNPETVPDPQAVATFERSRLNWAELHEPAHATLFDWYRALIALRASEPALRDGSREHLTVDYSEHDAWLVVHRRHVSVVCNLGAKAAAIPIDGDPRVLLSSSPGVSVRDHHIVLPSHAAVVLSSAAPVPE
jgi:maltooligosyltrehalose trehalohydrolase